MAKLSTQSYFVKRLRDSGYLIWKIFEKYHESDPRKWTIVVDPGNASIFCTCYDNHPDFYQQSCFEFYDGGQFIPGKFLIATESMEVIMEYLHRFNINNKTEEYHGKFGRT